MPVGPNRNDYLGPVSVQSFSEFCNRCRVPAKARLQLLQWVLFNLLIGNSDSHGKNISFFVSKKGYELAPLYDLLNITIYEEFNHELAFEIGDTFSLKDVKAYQLLLMSQEMNLAPRFVAAQLRKICTAVLKQVDLFDDEFLTEAERAFVNKLIQDIKERSNIFLQQVPLIELLKKTDI